MLTNPWFLFVAILLVSVGLIVAFTWLFAQYWVPSLRIPGVLARSVSIGGSQIALSGPSEVPSVSNRFANRRGVFRTERLRVQPASDCEWEVSVYFILDNQSDEDIELSNAHAVLYSRETEFLPPLSLAYIPSKGEVYSDNTLFLNSDNTLAKGGSRLIVAGSFAAVDLRVRASRSVTGFLFCVFGLVVECRTGGICSAQSWNIPSDALYLFQNPPARATVIDEHFVARLEGTSAWRSKRIVRVLASALQAHYSRDWTQTSEIKQES